MTTTITTLDQVTAAEIATAERIVDCNTGRAFYLVQSSHYVENNVEYKVEAIKRNGKHYLTCTCEAGQKAIFCRHKRIALAAARVEKARANALAQETATNVDAATLDRVQAANRKPFHYSTREIEQDARHYASRPFSLLK